MLDTLLAHWLITKGPKLPEFPGPITKGLKYRTSTGTRLAQFLTAWEDVSHEY